MTQDEFCHQSDIPKQTYAAWENVRFSGLTDSGAERVVQRYKDLGILCTKSWLLEGIGAPPKKASDTSALVSESLETIAQELLLFSRKGNTLDYYITAEEMLPFFEKGDLVAGYSTPLEKSNGKYSIVLFEEGTGHHKIFGRVNLHQQQLTVSFLNPQFPARCIDKHQILSIAPVLWHRKPHLE